MRKNSKIEARIALLKNGIKQTDIAKSIGVSDAFITQFLNGDRKSEKVSSWFYKNLGVKI